MSAPELSGIDLQFRPRSYFWPLGLETHLLARIKGAERKAALKLLIDAGQLDEIPDLLAQSALGEEDRRALGRFHPAFMGGEYLANLKRDEVMIARITIASTTQDVTCIYARRGKNRIHYRVVDEYGGATLSGRNARTSIRPLTLGQLETFFTGAWSVFDVLAMRVRPGRYAGFRRKHRLGVLPRGRSPVSRADHELGGRAPRRLRAGLRVLGGSSPIAVAP